MSRAPNQTFPKEESTAPLVSTCQGCGGDVPVILSQPDPTCPYCGQTSSLSPEVGQKVRQLGEKLKARSAREDQFVGKQVKLIRSNPISLLVPMLIIWVFIGGWLLFAFKPPPEISFQSFLFEARQPAEDFDKVTGSWWLYWFVILGIGLTITLKGAAQVNLRRLVDFVLPIQPISRERSPRCRRCGAELPADGAVRRCQFCQADHIVLGDRYQRMEKSLDLALTQMGKSLDQTLAVKGRRAERAFNLGGILPFILAVLGLPVGLFLGGTRPLLWLIPGILLLAGPILYFMAGRMKIPETTRSLENWAVGDEIIIDQKTSYTVVGGVYVGQVGEENQGRIACLARSDKDDVSRALYFPSTGQEHGFIYYKAKQGGQPFSQSPKKEAKLESVDVLSGSGGLWGDREQLWAGISLESTSKQEGQKPRVREIRLYADEAPKPDDKPLVTLYAPQDFSAKRLSLA